MTASSKGWLSAMGAFIAVIVASACSATPEPCSSPQSCGPRRSCVASRCAPPNAEPAPVDAQRLVLHPSEMAVVSGQGDEASPSEIALGGPGGSLIVLLRFAIPWANRVRIASAFLTLEPAPDSTGDSTALPVSIARVLG